MKRIENRTLTGLTILSQKIVTSIENSSFEKELEVFETIQVHAGCGGCSGTQMACNIDVIS